MTEQLPQTSETPPATPVPIKPKRGPLGRLGCALGLLVWIVLILSPCLLFTLATQGELTLALGSAPGQTARLWLVMEADERGIGLSTPSVQASGDGHALCVQTDVRYFLWQGRVEPSSYCECYRRANADAAWEAVTLNEGICSAETLDAAARP